MSPQSFPTLEALQQRVNSQLTTLTNPEGPGDVNHASLQQLADACTYVVNNGGKRVRPALLYLAAHAVNPASIDQEDHQGTDAAIDYAACAIELLHTYSLVHDDLPAMDDDDMRRGRPSCHVAYDEATAILVGDTLQARAFELLAIAPNIAAGQKVKMLAALARAAGFTGMVGGQYVDVQATDSSLTLPQLQAMHEAKTGAIIAAALNLGATVASADEHQERALQQFGASIGLAFQVVDDVLDVAGTSNDLGKTGGKDSAANKPTYVSLMGLEGAKTRSRELLETALKALSCFGESADPLRELGRFIVERDR